MAKILVIDDDRELVESVTDVLKADGHNIIAAGDGAGGYNSARREKPEVILLDVMMATDSEGFEIARKLNEDPGTRDIPVILMTGIKKAKGLPFSYEPDKDWLPVSVVLDKPVKPDLLLASVRQALK